MGIFSTKQIVCRKNSLGALLKNTRLKHKLKLRHIEEYTNIRRSYIVAIENNQWDQLPDLTYAKNFVLTYAKFLELDLNKIENRFNIEIKYCLPVTDNQPLNNLPQKPKIIITPRFLTVGLALFFIAIIGIYTYYQIDYFLQTPKLNIQEPTDYTEVSVNKVNITGQTDPENIIYINNQPLTTDKNGNFSTPIQLQNGYNIIKVTAKNKIGKTITSTKIVVARLEESQTTKPFTLSISAKDSDIWVRLKDKNKQTIFDDSIAKNDSKEFTPDDTVFLTTTNAGCTSVEIDQKPLGILGQSGEIIEDMAISNHLNSKNI